MANWIATRGVLSRQVLLLTAAALLALPAQCRGSQHLAAAASEAATSCGTTAVGATADLEGLQPGAAAAAACQEEEQAFSFLQLSELSELEGGDLVADLAPKKVPAPRPAPPGYSDLNRLHKEAHAKARKHKRPTTRSEPNLTHLASGDIFQKGKLTTTTTTTTTLPPEKNHTDPGPHENATNKILDDDTPAGMNLSDLAPGPPPPPPPPEAPYTAKQKKDKKAPMMKPLKDAKPMAQLTRQNLTDAHARDCIQSDWSEWSDCLWARTEGRRGATQVRSRKMAQAWLVGGKPCGPFTEEQECRSKFLGLN